MPSPGRPLITANQVTLARLIPMPLLSWLIYQGAQRGYKADREDLTPGEKALLQRLSDEQGKLGTLLKTFVSKFEEAKKQYDKKGPKDE